MGLFNDKQISQTPDVVSQQGPPGIGFKLESDGNYDMDQKKIFNLETQDDVPNDSDYETIKKDYKSVPNKEYLNNHFLKRNKNGVFYDLKGFSIQNSEVYDPNTWDNKTITNKEYVDLRDNLKADKTDLDKKADLTTNNEQTFKSIINVPDFDPGYSNMTNVMNKKYIDQKLDMKTTVLQKIKSRLQVPDYDGSYTNQKDVPNLKYLSLKYLNKEAGGQLQNSILFNSFHTDEKKQIYYLGKPLYNTSATNKEYVDSELQNKADSNKVMLIDGTQAMEADLDMGGYIIKNITEPKFDSDGVNKKYLVDYIGKSHIQSINSENKFKYIMNDPKSQISDENDVELGDTITFNNSPHKINKNVIDMKLLLDNSKGYYSSRIGFNLFLLSNSDYTCCIEIMWLNDNIDPDSISIDGSSSIESIHNINRKTFKKEKYVRLICQFTKSQNIGNNYLYIDMIFKMKSGSSYDQKLQTYLIIYGIYGNQSNIEPSIYDQIYYILNDELFFNNNINMNRKQINNLKDATNNNQAVNLKQLLNHFESFKIILESKTTELETKIKNEFENKMKNSYEEIFETYFDITDANNFIVDDTYGAEVKYVKCQNDNGFIVTEYMKDDFDLSLFNKQLGTVLNGSVISLSKTISTNKYTIFISFKHNTTFTDATKNLVGFGGITNDKKFTYSDPRYSINNQKLIIDNQNDNNHQLSVLSQYQNKNLFMWIMKNGNNVRYGLVNGAYLDKTVNVRSVTTRNIIIELPYKIKRIGISTNAYSFSSKEFNKICFLEKGNGVYFI